MWTSTVYRTCRLLVFACVVCLIIHLLVLPTEPEYKATVACTPTTNSIIPASSKVWGKKASHYSNWSSSIQGRSQGNVCTRYHTLPCLREAYSVLMAYSIQDIYSCKVLIWKHFAPTLLSSVQKYNVSITFALQREERRRRAKEMLKKHKIDALRVPSSLSSTPAPSSTRVINHYTCNIA